MSGDTPLTSNPLITLVHAHDKVWNARTGWTWQDRFAACTILWNAAINVAKELPL
jgi:hypothetical protein